jgi:RNA polymerase primary sigma factor
VPKAIERFLLMLNGREQAVIRLRYGLEDDKVHTLEQVAQKLQVTRERARQIEHTALSKLRHPSARKTVHDMLAL